MSREPRKPREPVLCVLHADGWLEVFGRKNLNVHVATMTAMGNAEGERVAEDYLSLALPRQHREIYFPGLLRATGLVQEVRPHDIAWRKTMTTLVDAAGHLAKPKEVTAWTH